MKQFEELNYLWDEGHDEMERVYCFLRNAPQRTLIEVFQRIVKQPVLWVALEEQSILANQLIIHVLTLEGQKKIIFKGEEKEDIHGMLS